MASDILFPAALPGASTFTAELIDNDGGPAGVLQAKQNFTITMRWSVSRGIASVLGGEWEIRIYAEAIGPGPEVALTAPLILPVDGRANYYLPVLVPGGTLPDHDQQISGAYKIIVLLGHRNHGRYSNVSAVTELRAARIG